MFIFSNMNVYLVIFTESCCVLCCCGGRVVPLIFNSLFSALVINISKSDQTF